jgi:DNA-binding transcriptional ArsR family regulator
MGEPTTAASLAKRLGLPRQRVSYHLHELEKAGVIRFVEERKKGNCVERRYVATAASYLLDPGLLGPLAADPERIDDRQSSAYLIAVAARAIRELAELRGRADAAGRGVPTISVVSEVRFTSSADRNAFAEELANVVEQLVREYSTPSEVGRLFKLFVGGYPASV